MRKIDLDRLLEECSCLVSTDHFVCEDCKHNLQSEPIGYCIRNVAESLVEPEIDFDALLEEYEGEVSIRGFVGFLKSKHLTAPKKFEIPTKKTWTLKPEFERYSRSINHVPTTLHVQPIKDPNPEFYDLHEEPDYSKIPVGAVVGIDFTDGFYCGVVERFTGKEVVISCKKGVEALGLSLEHIKSIEILKMPEVK